MSRWVLFLFGAALFAGASAQGTNPAGSNVGTSGQRGALLRFTDLDRKQEHFLACDRVVKVDDAQGLIEMPGSLADSLGTIPLDRLQISYWHWRLNAWMPMDAVSIVEESLSSDPCLVITGSKVIQGDRLYIRGVAEVHRACRQPPLWQGPLNSRKQ